MHLTWLLCSLLPPRSFFTLVSSLLLLLVGPAVQAQHVTWQMALATNQTPTATSQVRATALDAQGNVYLVGSFSKTIQLGSTTLTANGLVDVFVAKWCPPTNVFCWAQQAGGPGYEAVNAIAVAGKSVYIAGDFMGADVRFGPATLSKGSSNTGAFVAKLTDRGTTASFAWVQEAAGNKPSRCAIHALAVSGTSVYVAGEFLSAGLAFGRTLLASSPNKEALGDLFDEGDTGRFAWTQRAGGSSRDEATGLAVAGKNVYVVGQTFSPTADFGSQRLTLTGYANSFVAKLRDAGQTGAFVWVQSSRDTDVNEATAVAVSGTNVYFTGSFRQTAQFGATTLISAGSRRTGDIFVAKLRDEGATGRFLWAQRAGDRGDERPYGIAVSGTGVYLTGTFEHEHFDATTFGTTSLTSRGKGDMFVAKFTDAGLTASFSWVQQAGGPGEEAARTIVVTSRHVYIGGVFYGSSTTFGRLSLPNPTAEQRGTGFLASLAL